MMSGKFFCKRGQILFMLFFFLGAIVLGQDGQVDKDKELREEILDVYKAGGEEGLRGFVKKEKDKISNKFIVDFAKAGVIGREEEWLEICEIIGEEKKDEKTQADVLIRKGEYFRVTSDIKKAKEYFDKALPIYLKLKDQVGQGNVYLSKGYIYKNIGKIPKALEMFDKALFAYEKARNLIGLSSVYESKGDIYFRTGENSKAFEMYDKAILFFKKAESIIGQGNVYRSKGDIYLLNGENLKALEMYDKALPLFVKSNDLIGQGNVYNRKGDINLKIGDYSEAIEMYDRALPFFKKAGEPIGQGNIYKGKGNIYLRIGENSKALEMYDRALPFFKKAGEPIGQGYICMGKGDIYLRIGENSKAIEMYNKALLFFERARVPIGQAQIYSAKGNIYFYIGDNSRANEMYDKALLILKRVREPLGQGIVYKDKGNIYQKTGNYLKALEMYDKAIPFFEKVGDPIGKGNVYLRKGNVYYLMGNKSKALEMYDKALLFFKKVAEPLGEGNVHLNKGDVYLSIGKKSKALEMYNKAFSFYKKNRDNESKSYALHGQAKVLVKMGKKQKARTLFETGITYLEKVRMQTAVSEMKQTFMEKVYQQYQETVLFMLDNKYNKKGFKYAESMKSRVFLDRMAEELMRLEKGLTPELKEKRDNLVTKLSSLNKQIYEAAGGKDEKKLQELKEQYRKAGDEFEEMLIKIRLENPLYASVRYPEPITVQELQKEVLKKGEILVRYFISPDRLYVFLVSKKIFKVFPLDVTKQEIKGLVEEHLRAIEENNSIHMKRYGKILYEKLFKPLEKRVKKSKDIIIVPDGELATIPFESFILDNKGQDRPVFLLEKYRVKYLQSASLLKILRQHYQKDRETNNFIGFGDPVYDYENFKLGKPEKGSMKILATESTEVTESIFSHEDTRSDTKGKRFSSESSVASVATTSPQAFGDEIKEIHRDRYARAGGIMDRLQASGEEVKTIARLFEKKSQKSVLHLREEATEDNAGTPAMKDFDYIHFTCHGLLNDDFQSLVLSQLPPDKAKEDGYFTLNEIMNCGYNAKLVVLSACKTGSGKLERAEGVTGMARAVMYAGTPAVIASLWKVDDEATKELMVNFYKNMLEKNLDKAEALRQAKLELINNKKYRSPLFWSAFVMYGE